MRKLILLVLVLVILVACQAGDETAGPRAILEWHPTPYSERTPPAEVSLPAPEPSKQRPAIAEPEQSAAGPAEIPEMAPTLMPLNIFVSQANGFSVPFPSSWEILESEDQSVRLYDPTLDVILSAIHGFQDDETSYESTLDMFLEDEEGFFGDVTIDLEEEIPFAGEGLANSALLVGEEDSIWMAYAEAESHNYIFVAFGDLEDLEARQATLKSIVSQVQLAGDHIYGLDRPETLVLRGGDPIPRDLDPARQTGSAANLIGLPYSGLVRLTPELQIEPDLAESWTVNEDGTEYTFTLRDGIKFHSGKAITASDFQYSWERAADPETDSTTAATYLGDILGVPEKLKGEAETISGVEVVDDQTLVVTLDGPKPYFLLKLTYPTSFVVDEDSVDPTDENWVFEPNASGPFTLSEFHEEAAIIFERNENYFSVPAIPNVIYLLYRLGSPISLFESGEVDVVAVGGNEAQRIRQPEDELHEHWLSTTSLCTNYVQINNTMKPMDDPNVRRAFALAVDKEGLNELLNEGMALVAESILPPAMPGYSAENVNQRIEQGYDPEAAKEALMASDYASGLPPITFSAGGYGSSERQDINALVAGWQEVLGANITVEYLPPEDYTRASRENHGHLANYGWCADYPDPENFLDILFHSESEFNVVGYANPEIDSLLEEARIELDPAKRLAHYQAVEAALLADGAVIPLYHGVADVLVNPRVKGYVLSPAGAPIVHRLSLEPVEGDE